MSDAPVEQIPVIDEQPALLPVASVTAGQMIKEARVASGLHIGTLSMALKVPVKKLEALESEDWIVLPDVVFVRALATSVCRQIKLDSAPVLAALPQVARYRAVTDDGEKAAINQPFHSAADAKFSWSKLPISMPMIAGALVLLLAAVVLIFLPSFSQQTLSSRVLVPEAPAITPIFPPTATADTTNPQLTSIAVQPASALVVASTPVISASAPTVTASNGPVLRVTAKGVVWIEVKDAKGLVLVQRTLQPKEVASVSGQSPLTVVIGRINEIESISVRGKPFNMAGMSPDNVARFEVK